jgi:hypothetical protein
LDAHNKLVVQARGLVPRELPPQNSSVPTAKGALAPPQGNVGLKLPESVKTKP